MGVIMETRSISCITLSISIFVKFLLNLFEITVTDGGAHLMWGGVEGEFRCRVMTEYKSS